MWYHCVCLRGEGRPGKNHVGYTPAFDLSVADDVREYFVLCVHQWCKNRQTILSFRNERDPRINDSIISGWNYQKISLIPTQKQIVIYLIVRQQLKKTPRTISPSLKKWVNVCMQTITCTRAEVICERTVYVDIGHRSMAWDGEATDKQCTPSRLWIKRKDRKEKIELCRCVYGNSFREISLPTAVLASFPPDEHPQLNII